MATDVADAVRFAGGWIYDQVAAGLRVAMLAGAVDDSLAARVLGADVIDMNAASRNPGGSRAALAVTGDPQYEDERLRRQVRAALAAHLTDVVVWGEMPTNILRGSVVIHHRLSAAACLFKGHALRAAGLRESVEPFETFRAARGRHGSPRADCIFVP